ncbi:CDC48 family AAA ATPase [Candidatus Micrarchaeota archaeon]|nr:CDC48 family AAA ATPase [Candidatus Micrarchaeota archaeon]MBU2476188.1 CDC48 family AAA ATPase [Candidatus Micrarchaeota archaeon]
MISKPKKGVLELRAHDADQSHVGRGIITLDRQSKEYLGVTSGDIVELEATKKTAAIIWPAKSTDEGRSIIRMDSLVRHSCGASLGEKVKVLKAVYSEAKKVVLAPTQEIRIIASGYDRILKKGFIGRPMNRGDNVWISVFGSGFIYKVIDTNPRGIVKVTDLTQFELKDQPAKEELEGIPRVTYDDVGGLKEQVQKVREMIELPMKHPELFTKLGINPPKGVLLHGPPGTGKTLLAKAVAYETQAHFVSVSAPSIMSKFVGEAEERVRQIFKEAEENSPSIIFIDELDAIAPKREEVLGEVERRVVAQLLSAMDGMEARGNVIVIAATNRVNSLDEALRRPGRFDREIEIGVPDKKGRKDILQIHTRGMPLTQEGKNAVDLDYFASITHGFVGADLAALGKESAMKALRRYLPEINMEEEKIPTELLESLEVNKNDFSDALKEVQPSALREVLVEVPNVKWADIGSLNEVKDELKQAVEWPLKNPEAFKKMGINPPKGVLLYGPPGTGKTLLAKAVATESEANFISIKGPELVSRWVGETERGIRKIFKKARQVAPVIVFFDEIDSLAGIRGSTHDSGVGDRAVNQLLTELDGIEELKDMVFIAATNRPDLIDSGLLRPGRIDKLIMVPAPDEKARKEIFKIHLKKVPLEKEINLEELAKKSEGFSGADIEGLVREAALISLKENKMEAKPLKQKHFDEALKKIRPSISKETIEAYEEFSQHYSVFKPSYVD